ncbi:hypothetical protein [Segnochrobactrum spirostomi]|nr:hypothetical protein [Segnochrobactrum spirostomi]
MAIVAAALVAGCVSTTTSPPPDLASVKFDPAASAYVLAKGDGAIEGQAYVRSVSNGIMPAKGSRVILLPVTPYHEARIAAIYGTDKAIEAGSKTIPNPPAAFGKYQRIATADDEGRFTFRNVAPGQYFIITSVAFPKRQIGLYDRVKVTAGETTRITVTGS